MKYAISQYKKAQSGMTFIGIVLMLAFLGLFALAGLKILPLYYENLGVQKSLESLEESFKSDSNMAVGKVRLLLQRSFDVNEVHSINAKEISIKKGKGGYVIDASYVPRANYLGNLDFAANFEHKLELKK